MATQGYADPHEKKGIAEKVKGLLGGHGHKTDSPTAASAAAAGGAHPQPVYGDATPTTGNAESTRVGCLDKIKSKAGVGHSSAAQQAGAHGHGHGHGPGEGAFSDPNTSPDFNGGTNVNSSAAVHGGWPHPTNPRQGVAAHAEHRPSPGVAHPNQAPGAGYDQAATGYGGPQHQQQAPGVGYDQAASSYGGPQHHAQQQAPGAGYDQAANGYGGPQHHAQQQAPGAGYDQAASGYGGPQHQQQAPGVGYDQAASGYGGPQHQAQQQAPGAGYDQAASSYGGPQHHAQQQAPGAGYDQAASGYGGPQHQQAPGAGYDQAASGYGGPVQQAQAQAQAQQHPTNPTGVTNPVGGAVLQDQHGNVHEGPRDDTVKKEGFMSKIMDKLHSPKGKPAHTATATTATPASY